MRPRGRILPGSPRVRGPCAASARRHRDPSRPVGCRERRGPLPRGAGPRRAARHAASRGPLPPRPRQALPAHRQAGAGPRAPHHRDDDVPRDGHAVLAGAGRTGAEGTGVIRSVTRRSFLASSLAGLAAPLAAGAQEPARPRRVGYLSVSTPEGVRVLTDAFRGRLRVLGWQEPNLVIEHRFADGNLERLPELAGDLVRLRVDVIYAPSTPAALAVQKATQIIPVVMMTSEPLATRLVGSLARPTGNLTGLTNSATELAGKQLELLRELVAGVSRIAFLSNPANAVANSAWVQNAEGAARTLGLRLEPIDITGPQDIERGLVTLARAHPGALLVGPDPFFVGQRTRIVQFVANEKIPRCTDSKRRPTSAGSSPIRRV